MMEPLQDIIREGKQPAAHTTGRGGLGTRLARGIYKLITPIGTRLPWETVRGVTLNLLRSAARRLPAGDALRLLLQLDNDLYALQTETAVRYGEGAHTKQRHLDYPAFFRGRVKRGERVLDVGCGQGIVSFMLADAGARVVGMDIDEGNIARCRARFSHPQLEFRVGDALALSDESFDVVVLSNVLEHLPRRDEFLKRLQEAARPKRVLIRVPVFERDWRVPLKHELGLEWRLDPTHETEFTLENFRLEMTAGGLVIEHLESRWGEIWAECRPQAG